MAVRYCTGYQDADVSLHLPAKSHNLGILLRLLPFTAAKREARQLKKQYRPPKPGEAVYKGHRSYDLMRELQLGLTFSIAQAEVGWAGRALDAVGSLAVL